MGLVSSGQVVLSIWTSMWQAWIKFQQAGSEGWVPVVGDTPLMMSSSSSSLVDRDSPMDSSWKRCGGKKGKLQLIIQLCIHDMHNTRPHPMHATTQTGWVVQSSDYRCPSFPGLPKWFQNQPQVCTNKFPGDSQVIPRWTPGWATRGLCYPSYWTLAVM